MTFTPSTSALRHPAEPRLYSLWHALLKKADALRGAASIRTLRGLESWPSRWTFGRFAVETKLGIPNHGLLAPTTSHPKMMRAGYVFSPRDCTTDREVLWHFHEVQTRAFLRRYLAREGKGGVFIDVGAHCGSMCIPFEAAFDLVLAVEPMPDNQRALERNIALNALEAKIHRLDVAAGAVSARSRLYLQTEELHSLLPQNAATETLEVDVQRLDDLIAAEGVRPADVRLLKVDVEGAESQVLTGAPRLLEDGRPLVLLEANTMSARKELEDQLAPLGYFLLRVADDRNLFFARSLEPIAPRALTLGVRLVGRLSRRRAAMP